MKKILLMGEYSGLYKNLKEGLEELGYETKIVANGDGWKNVQCDILIKSNRPRGFYQIDILMQYYKNRKEFRKHNVVQIINPGFLFLKPITKFLYDYIIYHNDKVYISAVGDDYYYIKKLKEYRYSPYMNQDNNSLLSQFDKKATDYILNRSDGIIAGSYDYAQAYRKHPKFRTTIPFPINTKKIKYKENEIQDKIVIFHGLNREDFKGTKYIEEALSKIKKKYANKVEIIIDGKMPLKDYLKVIERTNIIIDQCKSYGYGMNAIYSLAMGKVVLSGAEPEATLELGVKDFCPVINIIPNSSQIFKEIEKFIISPELIRDYGKKGREYIEKYHDYKKVAQQYINIWNIE